MSSRPTTSRIPAKRTITSESDPASRKRVEKPVASTSSLSFRTSAERRVAAAEESQRALEHELSQAKATIARLESDRRWLSEREEQEKEARTRLEEVWNSERDELSATNRRLRTTNLELEARLGDLEDAHTALKRSADSTIASQASNLTSAERRAVLLQEELQHAHLDLREKINTITQLHRQLDELEESRANASVSMDTGQWGVVQSELKSVTEELQKLRSNTARLTAENTKLRSRNQNVELLREEKRDLERKLSRMQEYKDRASQLQGELEAAMAEKEAWTAFINDPSAEPTSSTPSAITNTIISLRHTNASLSDEVGRLRGTIQHQIGQLSDFERRLQSASSQIAHMQTSLRQAEESSAVHVRNLELARREVESYKHLVATFDRENAMHREDADGGEGGAAAELGFFKQRIGELEQTLEAYKNELERTSAQLADLLTSRGAAPPGSGGDGDIAMADVDTAVREDRHAKDQLESDLAQATTTISSLESKIQSLEQQLWEAGVSTAIGTLIPRSTSILQISANPAAEHFALRRQELDRLKGENEALLKMVKRLEEGGGVVGEDEMVVPRRSLDNALRENGELGDTLKQKDLRLLRLQQVFKAKAGEFRDATSSILGWKLLFQSTRVRLTSQFDPTASMVFDSIGSSKDMGTMKVISLADGGEGGPTNMRSLMQFWVNERNSIPCFLAALTLECYEEQAAKEREMQAAGREEVTMDITRQL